MYKPTREQFEAKFGKKDIDAVYPLFCQFVDAVNAEHAARPETSERECIRIIYNSLATRYGSEPLD